MRLQSHGVKKPLRITAALLTLCAIIGIADFLGWGHNYLGFLLLVGVFFGVRSLNERGWRWLLGAMLPFSLLVTVIAVVQMWFMPRARGPFLSANFLGGFSVLMFFLAADRLKLSDPVHSQMVCPWPRRMTGGLEDVSRGWLRGRNGLPRLAFITCPRFFGPASAANLLSLALSQSRGAILALGAGLCVMLARKRPAWALVPATLALLVAGSLRPGIEDARFGIWRIGWQAAKQRFLLGYGQGGLWIAGMTRFYNVPLDLLLAAGILGLLAGAWLMIEAARAARNQPAMLGFLAAWLVSGFFIFETPATMIPFFVVLGRLASEARQQQRGVDQPKDDERAVEDDIFRLSPPGQSQKHGMNRM